MAESDSESRFDEMERDNLQKVISEVEAAQAASRADKKPMLDHFLQNARGRVAVLDKRIKESKAENESRHQAAVTVAALAARETALSTSEKETYSGFLAKDFFTKKDFGSLENFYAKTWDRLSESGKDQMSHRIWEGIRRDEYKFTDLPKVVREKEAEHAYKRLHDAAIGSVEAEQIPAKDRADFFNAYEAGKREEAAKILERDSFKTRMFRGTESKPIDHRDVEMGNEKTVAAIGARIRDGDAPAKPARDAANDDDFSTVSKAVGKITETSVEPSAANIPNAKTSQPGRGSSVLG